MTKQRKTKTQTDQQPPVAAVKKEEPVLQSKDNTFKKGDILYRARTDVDGNLIVREFKVLKVNIGTWGPCSITVTRLDGNVEQPNRTTISKFLSQQFEKTKRTALLTVLKDANSSVRYYQGVTKRYARAAGQASRALMAMRANKAKRR